MPLAYCSYSYN
ncbi:uncharacterized protein FFC1_12651 [Fusarium fujikuroi]|nr:uncharacterized protein FFC1_12651 [Fusarium fujikuroi]